MKMIIALAQQFGQFMERQHLEREGYLLSAAVEQASESILITDVDGVIQYVNTAFERLTGFSRNEAIGRNPRMLKSGKHPPAFYAKLWRTIKAGKVWSGQIVNRRKDGKEYVQHLVISPVQFAAGTAIAFVGSARDIGAELEMEKRLQQAKSMETIGLITAGVAHEVRNPLFAISTLAKGLETKLADHRNCSEFTLQIQDQVRRLNDLMADLLALGRPADPSRFLPVDMRDVVADAVRTLSASDAGLPERCVLDIGEDRMEVVGDRARLSQVFVNLLNNAATLSHPDEKIGIRFLPAKGLLRIQVSDRGPGIPGDLVPSLFEPFQSRRKGGTGLGLAIVRKIVNEHGGAVFAQNNSPAPGATFTIHLPLADH